MLATGGFCKNSESDANDPIAGQRRAIALSGALPTGDFTGSKSVFLAHDYDIDRMHRRLRCGRSGNMQGSDPDAAARSNPSHLATFTALFYESEMRTLHAALSHYQALCRREIAPGTPFWAHYLDFDSVRSKLSGVAGPNDQPDDDFL